MVVQELASSNRSPPSEKTSSKVIVDLGPSSSESALQNSSISNGSENPPRSPNQNSNETEKSSKPQILNSEEKNSSETRRSSTSKCSNQKFEALPETSSNDPSSLRSAGKKPENSLSGSLQRSTGKEISASSPTPAMGLSCRSLSNKDPNLGNSLSSSVHRSARKSSMNQDPDLTSSIQRSSGKSSLSLDTRLNSSAQKSAGKPLASKKLDFENIPASKSSSSIDPDSEISSNSSENVPTRRFSTEKLSNSNWSRNEKETESDEPETSLASRRSVNVRNFYGVSSKEDSSSNLYGVSSKEDSPSSVYDFHDEESPNPKDDDDDDSFRNVQVFILLEKEFGTLP